MAGRRDVIKMTPEEVDAFLGGRHSMSVATIGRDGSPHLVAMWYGFLDGSPAFWTYSRSQKILNLRRDPRITCMVEAGDTYPTLQGVELVGTGEVIDDPAVVQVVGESVHERYNGPINDAARAGIAAMGAKRAAVRIGVAKVVSWDHNKLGGAY
jgi:PPOX class probable F420-dependent enzyme